MIYQFGEFTFDTDQLELRAGGEVKTVEPQVFSLLAFLIENRDRVVTKDEIFVQVWDGRIVSDGALNSRINAARRALGDDGKAQAVIKTFPRRGFRFVAEVIEDDQTKVEAAPPALPDKPSIAVLPFDNLSGDSDQDYIGDGLTEDIIAGLSRIRSFFVIARNSTFQYKGASPDIRRVSEELGVRYVLEGSVRKAGDRVRVTAQLIDGSNNNHLWVERFDRDFTDIFAVQDEITETIIAQLEPEVGRAEYERVKSEPPENLDAWELYHRGLTHIFRRTKEDILQGRNFFERAIELDPNFAGGHAGIAWTFSQDAFFGATEKTRATALDAAQTAVALDDKDAFAHVALGQAHASNGEIAAAAADYEEAIRINPSNALARSLGGSSLSRSGKAEEAIAHLELAILLSPSDPGIAAFYARLTAANLYLEQYEAAVEWGRKSVQKNVSWTGRVPYASAFGHLGRREEARAACEDLLRLEPDTSVEFVRNRILMPYRPYMNHLLEGLRKAGVPEA